MNWTVNGVALNNPPFGWYLRPVTVPFSAVTADITTLTVPSMDGETTGLTTLGAPVLKFTVNTTEAGLGTLNALFTAPTLTLRKESDASIVATVSLLSSEVTRVFPRGEYIDMTYIVQIDQTYWRGPTTTTDPVVLTTANQTISDMFPGVSGPIQDAIVRVKGGFAGLSVKDSSNAWFSYNGTVATGRWLRFHARTGRAFLDLADDWGSASSTEVSGQIDYGGPRGVFEMWPTWDDDIRTRYTEVIVSTTSRTSNPSVQIQAKAAFIG